MVIKYTSNLRTNVIKAIIVRMTIIPGAAA